MSEERKQSPLPVSFEIIVSNDGWLGEEDVRKKFVHDLSDLCTELYHNFRFNTSTEIKFKF